MVEYFDKQGKKANKDLAGPEVIAEFQNDVLIVRLIFNGELKGSENYFASSRPLFKTEVKNKVGDNWFDDAVEYGKSFPNEKKAMNWYEDFIMEWTKSYLDDEGELVEVGNILTPPPPENLNKPKTVSDSIW